MIHVDAFATVMLLALCAGAVAGYIRNVFNG